MKFVAPLTEAEQITLLEARDHGPTAALRRRAQAVELSSRGYRLAAIAELLAVHRETVSGWFDLWATPGLRGLYDPPVGDAPRALRQLKPSRSAAQSHRPRASSGRSRRGCRNGWGNPPAGKPCAGWSKTLWLGLEALPAVAQAPP